MQKVTVEYNIYSYDELSGEAKERVKRDYCSTPIRDDEVKEYVDEILSGLFPKKRYAEEKKAIPFANESEMECERSYFTQGSGVNIFGEIRFEDFINLIYKIDRDADFYMELDKFHKACRNAVSDIVSMGYDSPKALFKATSENLSYYLILTVPEHNDSYTYSLADMMFYADKLYPYYELSLEDELEFEGVDMKTLTILLKAFKNVLKMLDEDIYSITEDMYLTVDDEYMKEFSEANDCRYLENGEIFSAD